MAQKSVSYDARIIRRNLPRRQTLGDWLIRRWLALFLIGYGVFVALPFLAPWLKHIGWDGPANGLYAVYSFLCHQLPQQSYFLFGEKFTYSLAEIKAAWQNTDNPLILRRFIGSPAMGWKVAWSDRMVSLYGGVWVAAALWGVLRKRITPLGWRGMVLLGLPMAVDGLTHLISDFAGIGQGFRDSNQWLALITGNAFSASFYAGDAWGSFNSILRLLTGFLFALGVVWFSFPHLQSALAHQKLFTGENEDASLKS